MSNKKRNTGTPKPIVIDRIIWAILTPIVKPLVYLHELFFPEYEEIERAVQPREQCFCNSNIQYSECHLPKHKKKEKIAVRITRTYKKSRRTQVRFKVKTNERTILRKFKSGSINPLNKEGRFVDTDGYQSE